MTTRALLSAAVFFDSKAWLAGDSSGPQVARSGGCSSTHCLSSLIPFITLFSSGVRGWTPPRMCTEVLFPCSGSPPPCYFVVQSMIDCNCCKLPKTKSQASKFGANPPAHAKHLGTSSRRRNVGRGGQAWSSVKSCLRQQLEHVSLPGLGTRAVSPAQGKLGSPESMAEADHRAYKPQQWR